MVISSDESDDGLEELLIERVEKEYQEEVVVGRRIVDINHLVREITLLATHNKVCTAGRFYLVKELKKGLFSKFQFHCDNCNKDAFVTSEPIEKSNELNDALVWGAVSVGIGYSQSDELLGIMDVPIMGPKKFRQHESRVGKVRLFFYCNLD